MIFTESGNGFHPGNAGNHNIAVAWHQALTGEEPSQLDKKAK